MDTKDTTVEDVFIYPEGFCKKVTSDTTKEIRLESSELIKVYIVDPNRDNIFRLEESEIEGDFIGLIPQGNGKFQLMDYKVTYETQGDMSS